MFSSGQDYVTSVFFCFLQLNRPIVVPGECCPTCFPEFGTCIEGDNTYYDGQIWNVSKCEYCSCSDGKITCSKAQCALTECPPVSIIHKSKYEKDQ